MPSREVAGSAAGSSWNILQKNDFKEVEASLLSPHSGGGSRTLLEEDPFIGSSSNGRREHPPALPPLQGASSHEFIAGCSMEGRQRAKRALPRFHTWKETLDKGFLPRVSLRGRGVMPLPP